MMRALHRYLGLSIGIVFSITALSGSVLVFYPAIDAALHPVIAKVPSGARPASYDAVYAALVRAFPERSTHWRIELPADGGVIAARSLSPDDMAGRTFAPLIAWVDPRTNDVLRSDQWGAFFVLWLYDLHYILLLGPPGTTVVGILGAAVVVLLLSGTWAWVSRWRVPVVLFAARRASRQRVLFDLHRTLGICVSALLAVSAITGAMISLPGVTRSLLGTMTPLRSNPTLRPASHSAGARLSLDRLVSIAQQHLPASTLTWIETPASGETVVHLTWRQPFEPSPRFPHTEIWLDQASGDILGTRDPKGDGVGDTVLNWLHSVHNAEAFGLVAQWALVLLGLTPVVLLVSGTWWWWRRTTSPVGRDGRSLPARGARG